MYGAVLYAGAPYGGFASPTAVPGASSGYTSARAASGGRAARGGASRGSSSATAASAGHARRSR